MRHKGFTVHEVGITQTLLSIVLEKAKEKKASKISEISINVGELTNTVPDCIEFYFDIISKDTVAEGAKLKFKMIPVTARCSSCRTVHQVENMVFVCPDCSAFLVEVLSGKELEISKIKMDGIRARREKCEVRSEKRGKISR